MRPCGDRRPKRDAMITRVVSFDVVPVPMIVMFFDDLSPHIVVAVAIYLQHGDDDAAKFRYGVQLTCRQQFAAFLDRWRIRRTT